MRSVVPTPIDAPADTEQRAPGADDVVDDDRRENGPGELDPETMDTAAMFAAYRSSGDPALRNRLIEVHLHLADYHVVRFSRSAGAAADDLRQTAALAILKAVERFDPTRGVSFSTFGSRTIEGELKRYLRDRVWAVRPPRRVQEIHLRTERVADELGHRLGRSPSVRQIADELDEDEASVREAMRGGRARSAVSLDLLAAGGSPSPSGGPLADTTRDAGFLAVDLRCELEPVLSLLDQRQRQVLHLRYIDEFSQTEIAEFIGVSQSYVSRILRGALSRLRSELAERADSPDDGEGSRSVAEPHDAAPLDDAEARELMACRA